MTLQLFLVSVLSGLFALGPAVYLIMEHLQTIRPIRQKRFVVLVLSGVLSLGSWWLGLWLGYVRPPDTLTTEYVVSSVWSCGALTAFSAFTGATIIHGLNLGQL